MLLTEPNKRNTRICAFGRCLEIGLSLYWFLLVWM